MSVLTHDAAYQDWLVQGAESRRNTKLPHDDRWYVALWGPGEGEDRVRVMEAEPRGRVELDKTLSLFLLRCAEDREFYVVIRKSRVERTGAGLVTIRPPDEPPEVIV